LLINFGKGHSTVVGATQQGKTFGVVKSLETVKEGVFFFNVKQDKTLNANKRFTKADGKNSIKQLAAFVGNGGKLNFLPSTDTETMYKQAAHIIKKLHELSLEGKMNNFYFVADEMYIMGKDKKVLNELLKVATTGESLGMWGVFIGQRLANIDNTLITQCNNGIVLFRTQFEQNYFKNYGMDADQIEKLILQGGKYSYVHFDWTNVKGAYKV
jgi:hypothetical protein